MITLKNIPPEVVAQLDELYPIVRNGGSLNVNIPPNPNEEVKIQVTHYRKVQRSK